LGSLRNGEWLKTLQGYHLIGYDYPS
jgi:hypothetical protein